MPTNKEKSINPKTRLCPDLTGARRSRRFNAQIGSGPGISSATPTWTLKRAEARAPSLN
jgi:hypothetical protein